MSFHYYDGLKRLSCITVRVGMSHLKYVSIMELPLQNRQNGVTTFI